MSDQPFGDIPFFAELQKLLSSSSGGVNLQIAEQIAGSAISQAGSDPAPDADAERMIRGAVRDAGLMLGGFTRITVDEPATVRLINRRTWARSTLTSWSWIFEKLTARFSGGLEQQLPEEQRGQATQVFAQITPLLLGLQVGMLVGGLSQEVLARYDLPIPRDDDGELFLVETNVTSLAAGYEFDAADVRRWLVVRDAAHHMLLGSQPWIVRYFRSIVGELVDSVEIDMSDLERRLVELQSGGFEGMQDLGSAEMLPIVPTERHRIALNNVRAFISVFQGYANVAARAVAETLVPDAARIAEAVARHNATAGDGKAALQTLLGFSLDRQMQEAGETFATAILKLRGIDALNRVWAAPDNLPNAEEIRDPFAWIERVLDEGGGE